LLDTPPGFDPRNVLTLQISLPPAQYATPESQRAFYSSLLEQAKRIPGVESASACTLLPFGYGENFNTFEIIGNPKPAIDPYVSHSSISLGFFDTLKIPLIRGRSFLSSDGPNSEAVTIIDTATARAYFPGEDPIGRQMRFSWAIFRIVGVAGAIRASSLDQEPHPTVYFSAEQVRTTDMTLAIRSRLPERALAASIERIVHGLNKDQPVYDVFPLEARIARSVRTRRFVVSLILTFAASGAICAAIGLYGLLSYSIALRRRELGIRAALGADAAAIAALVYRGGFSIVAAGVALGSLSALATRRYIANQLYGTQFDDRLTWLAVLAIVTLMSALACALPARRAAKLDPMEALRAE
jgi:putative ABC transport system permease protein